MLSRQKQNMFKEANRYFTYKKMQLLKFKIFKKTNHINAFTVSNVHIFSSEEKKSDNKQEKVVIFEQDSRLCEAHFKISLFELKDTQTVILRQQSEFNNTDSHEEQSLEKL